MCFSRPYLPQDSAGVVKLFSQLENRHHARCHRYNSYRRRWKRWRTCDFTKLRISRVHMFVSHFSNFRFEHWFNAQSTRLSELSKNHAGFDTENWHLTCEKCQKCRKTDIAPSFLAVLWTFPTFMMSKYAHLVRHWKIRRKMLVWSETTMTIGFSSRKPRSGKHHFCWNVS